MFSALPFKNKGYSFIIYLILSFFFLGINEGFCGKKTHLKKINLKAAENKIKGGFEKVGKETKKGISKVEKGAKKELDKIGKALKKAIKFVVKEAEKELGKLGFSPDEMKEVFKCIKPTLKMVKDLATHPTNLELSKKISTSKCHATVRDFVEGQCSRPEFILATSVPYIGQGVGSICSRLESVLDKVDHVLEKSQEMNSLRKHISVDSEKEEDIEEED